MTHRIDDIEVPADEPFKYDQLDRKPVVDFLSRLIGQLDGPFVMALNSSYGTGKSTLVRFLIKSLEKEGHRCINFNAWKVDYSTDPLVALVASIDRIELGFSDQNQKNFDDHFQKAKTITTAIAKTSAVNIVKILTSGIIDPDAIQLLANSSKSKTDWNLDVVAAFNKESKLFNDFRDELTKAVNLLQDDETEGDETERESEDTFGSNLVIFVDELDRCRPTFAVHLLERIKHLFDIPNIVFVLSLDKNQIEASIKSVYGAEIDATEYLRRFFNLEFGIPVADTQNYISSLLTRFNLDPIFKERSQKGSQYENDRDNFVEYLNILANAMGLSLRAIERCITRLRIVMDQTPSNNNLDSALVALLIVLHSNRRDYYDKIIDGQVPPEDVIKLLTSLGDGKISQQQIKMLKAYLLFADPDDERVKKGIAELAMEQKKDGDAESIIKILEHMMDTYRSRIPLDQIAKKIDLASWVS